MCGIVGYVGDKSAIDVVLDPANPQAKQLSEQLDAMERKN